MYTERIIQRFKNPLNVGVIENADGIGEEGNFKCGDVMKIYIKVDNNRIQDIKFQTYGCVAAIVSSDILCDIAKGKTVDEALNIKSKDILTESGEMPPIKHHCSVIGAEALHKAIFDYKKKKGLPIPKIVKKDKYEDLH